MYGEIKEIISKKPFIIKHIASWFIVLKRNELNDNIKISDPSIKSTRHNRNRVQYFPENFP